MASSPPSRDQVLIHFYRAVVGHADVWRQRMDATTNWAAGTSAVMITFAFSSVDSPHFVLILSLAFNLVFLLMESRRYQTYDLWRRRFRILNRYLVVPALRGASGEETLDETARKMDETARKMDEEGLRALGEDLGHTVPPLGLVPAVGYRLRRNYGYLILVVLTAWLLKLEVHPVQAGSLGEVVARAAIGPVDGRAVLAAVGLLAASLFAVAVTAPSERMRNWQELPSPLLRLRALGRWLRRESQAAE